MANESYLKALFDPGALVCKGVDRFSTRIERLEEVDWSGAQFVSVNSFATEHGRLDANVGVFRNFLVEFDKVSLDVQDDIVKSSGLPWTTKVFSGSKSYHYVVSLEEPLKREEYARLAHLLLNGIFTLSDKNNKNPSRFTRIAGGIRPETGVVQELIDVRRRVTNEEMLKFLSKYATIAARQRRAALRGAIEQQIKIEKNKTVGLDFMERLNPRTIRFIETGAVEGDRHDELKLAVIDMFRAGADESLVEIKLQPIADQIGIGDRGDLESLIGWASKNVVPVYE